MSVRPPLFAGTFFEDQNSVDQFVSSYDAGHHMPDKVQYIYNGQCRILIEFFFVASLFYIIWGGHEFLAGDALRSNDMLHWMKQLCLVAYAVIISLRGASV